RGGPVVTFRVSRLFTQYFLMLVSLANKKLRLGRGNTISFCSATDYCIWKLCLRLFHGIKVDIRSLRRQYSSHRETRIQSESKVSYRLLFIQSPACPGTYG